MDSLRSCGWWPAVAEMLVLPLGLESFYEAMRSASSVHHPRLLSWLMFSEQPGAWTPCLSRAQRGQEWG